MPGPVPKLPGMRQRRNRVTTRSILPSAESAAKNKVPPLPKRKKGTGPWHREVKIWWRDVWKSPMASEYLGPDIQGGLRLLAMLWQDFWVATDERTRVVLSAEIRQQEVRFGLSPIDRRRLQWEVERGEEASDRTEKRRQRKRTPAETGKDPRDVLKAV